jgi:hypothetical protein
MAPVGRKCAKKAGDAFDRNEYHRKVRVPVDGTSNWPVNAECFRILSPSTTMRRVGFSPTTCSASDVTTHPARREYEV